MLRFWQFLGGAEFLCVSLDFLPLFRYTVTSQNSPLFSFGRPCLKRYGYNDISFPQASHL